MGVGGWGGNAAAACWSLWISMTSLIPPKPRWDRITVAWEFHQMVPTPPPKGHHPSIHPSPTPPHGLSNAFNPLSHLHTTSGGSGSLAEERSDWSADQKLNSADLICCSKAAKQSSSEQSGGECVSWTLRSTNTSCTHASQHTHTHPAMQQSY